MVRVEKETVGKLSGGVVGCFFLSELLVYGRDNYIAGFGYL